MGPSWFKYSEGNAAALEGEINAWLSRHPRIRVIDDKQSASGGRLGASRWVISRCYEDEQA
jgi:hypothetical protein